MRVLPRSEKEKGPTINSTPSLVSNEKRKKTPACVESPSPKKLTADAAASIDGDESNEPPSPSQMAAGEGSEETVHPPPIQSQPNEGSRVEERASAAVGGGQEEEERGEEDDDIDFHDGGDRPPSDGAQEEVEEEDSVRDCNDGGGHSGSHRVNFSVEGLSVNTAEIGDVTTTVAASKRTRTARSSAKLAALIHNQDSAEVEADHFHNCATLDRTARVQRRKKTEHKEACDGGRPFDMARVLERARRLSGL